MTPRPKEWVGKPLTRIPQTVKDRIMCRYGWRCADCRLGFGPHVKVWFEGKENRESRLKPYCPACHREHAHRDGRVRVGSTLIKDRFALSTAYLTNPEEGKSNGSNEEIIDGAHRSGGSESI